MPISPGRYRLIPAGHLRHVEPLLEPVERVSEILFGLIMVPTITGTLR
jgi:hypothetical protein